MGFRQFARWCGGFFGCRAFPVSAFCLKFAELLERFLELA
jgi:hypothetical protein